ncbi:hypothetical protein COCOBI_06-6460 [Coccomyxa sp. Obi]|nr:hypothetical protein COCOBI_06-6460 [Coccomyxa sp. Obi]
MEVPMLGAPETLCPFEHDDADFFQFLEGFDSQFSAPFSPDGSGSVDAVRDAEPRGEPGESMHATRFLPELHRARSTTKAIAEYSDNGTESGDYLALSFFDTALSCAGQDLGYQLQKPLPPTSEISSGVSTVKWRAAELKTRALNPFLQSSDIAWGHGRIQDPGQYDDQGTQAWAPAVHMCDREVPALTAAFAPNFSATPPFNPGQGSPGSVVTTTADYKANLDEAESCDSYEDQPKGAQQRTGGPRRKNTECWREKNRRIQRAFRQRQKEKQRAMEVAIEEMSERAAALDLENRQLQKALEDATRSVKRSKAAAKECSKVAVAVACGDGDAPVQLTSSELQKFTVPRMADVWKGLVRNMAVCFPEAERQPQGPYARRLETLAQEGCALMWALVDLNPAVLASFVSCDLEAAAQRPIGPGMWSSILERLKLSPEQRSALAATRRAMLANVGALLAERKQLVARAKGAAWVPGSSKLTADLQLAALVEQIHSNVEAIQLCTAFYISHAYIEILTPLQRARFFHQCYPYGPDLLSLMSAAASAENEPRASEIFQAVTSKTGSFQATAEWRKTLVQPLSRLRCATS